jgi:hypothetical protein
VTQSRAPWPCRLPMLAVNHYPDGLCAVRRTPVDCVIHVTRHTQVSKLILAVCRFGMFTSATRAAGPSSERYNVQPASAETVRTEMRTECGIFPWSDSLVEAHPGRPTLHQLAREAPRAGRSHGSTPLWPRVVCGCLRHKCAGYSTGGTRSWIVLSVGTGVGDNDERLSAHIFAAFRRGGGFIYRFMGAIP